MSEPRDEIAEILAAHAHFGRVAEPRNNADRNLGRTRYEMRCDCGAILTWNDSGAAHREHLAAILAERDRRVAGTAWFAGYDKGNLDGYFGTHDERAKSPYADLDPYRQEEAGRG